ncbi:hypothetical protein BUALT_Bualt12G0072600 [Buddleja alternifolia]|uniref:protein-serine/threonine phosphatase n=1 Tax=Buddleja alternifolia TaxID=168488 RepID=A0AAV6WPJ3_9LAMI|nr:hypothetical protein BUALT_Bualt12G0072600 [Buddleja alternifolia]
MFSWLKKSASSCLGPIKRCVGMDNEQDLQILDDDENIWSNDLEKHFCGEFSFAVAQANPILEDQSQVETGPHATFVGVYDGHRGRDAASYISNHLAQHIQRLVRETGRMSENKIRIAFSETENGFLGHVRGHFGSRPLVATIGSCCLVGVICADILYVANLGDSRAVMGCLGRSNTIVAEQLTQDHNAREEDVRRELQALHPDDPEIVVQMQGIWRVKGMIKVSRSIGDAFLKSQEFALDESHPDFHLSEPLQRPVLSADPIITKRNLRPNDKFLIFASNGLWDYLTNEEAVEIVHKNPRLGIAKRLLMSAIKKGAERTNTPYRNIKTLPSWERRNVHDDITIVVIFIDPANASPHEISVRGFVNDVGSSNFSI